MANGYPEVSETSYIAAGAKVAGNVKIGEECGIWYNAVVRADEADVTIGNRTNIQDNAVVHVGYGYDCHIGDGVTIGHGAIVHGCTVGDDTLIGMGAILLNGAKIGERCIIGAGALVTEGMVIPGDSVAFGSPAKVYRQMSVEDVAHNRKNAEDYVALIKEYKEGHYHEIKG